MVLIKSNKSLKSVLMSIDAGFWKQGLFTCSAYLMYCMFGIMRGYSAFLLPQLQVPGGIIHITTAEEASWIASLSIFPNPVGSLLGGAMMDKFGRTLSMKVAACLFLIGWGTAALSRTLIMLYAANVIVGVAIGMAVCSTLYVAEICEAINRCILLSLLEIFFSLGVLMSYAATYYLTWNIAASIFMIFSGFCFIIQFGSPESPYWLLKNGKYELALETLKKLRCIEIDDKAIEIECQHILSSIQNEKKAKMKYSLFVNNSKALFIIFLFHVILQGSGYNILLGYLSNIVSEFHITFKSADITLGYSAISFLASFLTPLTVYHWERKTVCMISGLGMTISMIILAFYHSCPQIHTIRGLSYLVPLSLYAYGFTCTVGILTLSQVMIGELYPTEGRGLLCGTSEAIATILTALSVKIYPMWVQYFSLESVLWCFAIVSFISIVFGKYVLPETYNKSLDDIQRVYFSKNFKESRLTKDDII